MSSSDTSSVSHQPNHSLHLWELQTLLPINVNKEIAQALGKRRLQLLFDYMNFIILKKCKVLHLSFSKAPKFFNQAAKPSAIVQGFSLPPELQCDGFLPFSQSLIQLISNTSTYFNVVTEKIWRCFSRDQSKTIHLYGLKSELWSISLSFFALQHGLWYSSLSWNLVI